MKKTPYDIIKRPYVTEKTEVLLSLKTRENNPCLKRYKRAKYTFIVDKNANKVQIARAVQMLFPEKELQVASVNIINVKKKKRVLRGQEGFVPGFKKAIVTLKEGSELPTSGQS